MKGKENLIQLKNEINQIKQEVISSMNDFVKNIEEFVDYYNYEEIKNEMSTKQKEGIFDRNFEIIKRSELVLNKEKILKTTINKLENITNDIIRECKNTFEMIGNNTNELICTMCDVC